MDDDKLEKLRTAADDILAFADEVEASGDVTIGGSALETARAVLHKWVDTVTGVVAVPAFGRVTLLHANGRESTISSPDLPFAISRPAKWDNRE